MRPMTIRVLFLGALALVLASCGDDSPAAAPEPASSTTALAEVTSSTATEAVPTTSAATTTIPAPTTTVAPATTTTEASSVGALADEVGAAIANNASVTSGRMEGIIRVNGIEGAAVPSIAITFSGAFDNEAQAFAYAMDLGEILEAAGDEVPPEAAALFSEIEIRQIGDTSYIKMPGLTQLLGIETEWISTPAEEGSGFATDAVPGLGGFAPVNPTELLAGLEEVGAEVYEEGRETIRGAETTVYTVVFDMETLLATSDPEELARLADLGPLPQVEFPMRIWIGDDGLVRRFDMLFEGSQIPTAPGEGFDSMVMRFDLFDLGEPVDIEAPPPDQVTDATELGGLFSA